MAATLQAAHLVCYATEQKAHEFAPLNTTHDTSVITSILIVSLSLSVHFNSHFSGGPELANTRISASVFY